MAARSERATDRAYRLIRGDIITGVLSGGSRLAETNLAERYGLSRTPVREALHRLRSEGLVELSPRRGARVFDWHTLDIAALYDMRAVVEGFLVRRAATAMPAEEIDRLARLCDEMERDVEAPSLGAAEFVDRFAEFNQRFHGAIARAAGGEFFAAVRGSVVVLPLVLRAVHDYTSEDRARSNRHHRELLDAIRARRPDWAESVMHAHVYSSKSRLLLARDGGTGPEAEPGAGSGSGSVAAPDAFDATGVDSSPS